MNDKRLKLSIHPQSSRREIADYINRAFETSDVVAVSHAIGDATRLHNISEIAKRAGIGRPSVYRAFGGQRCPNLSTVLRVLEAMGLQLKVTKRLRRPARLARARNLEER
jgi:probable addiction module antidote protein